MDSVELLERLDAVGRVAAPLYGFSDAAEIRLLNLSENASYLVSEAGRRAVLRVHRVGYHTREAIASELAWMRALRAEGVVPTPEVIPTLAGEEIVEVLEPRSGERRHCVMFTYLEGTEPPEHELERWFEPLGEVTARLHLHSRRWSKPAGFVRHTWHLDTMFGSRPLWGRWEDGIGVEGEVRDQMRALATTLGRRLDAYGESPERFGLIHADLRLANLLVDTHSISVIDFDDSGFSWYLYDLAAALTFIEHLPVVPALIDAWTRGYRRVAPISAEDEAEIPTFVMARRLIILAWIGSHIESPVAQDQGAEYTAATCDLAESYLSRFGHRERA